MVDTHHNLESMGQDESFGCILTSYARRDILVCGVQGIYAPCRDWTSEVGLVLTQAI